jgi:hypothetical protein
LPQFFSGCDVFGSRGVLTFHLLKELEPGKLLAAALERVVHDRGQIDVAAVTATEFVEEGCVDRDGDFSGRHGQ